MDLEIYKIYKNCILIFGNYTNKLILAYFKISEVFINKGTIIIANINGILTNIRPFTCTLSFN